MRMHTVSLSVTWLLASCLNSPLAWSCQSDPDWQDTLRCQFYPTSAQTPPPAPPAPSRVKHLADFTRVDLPELNASNQRMRCVDGTRPIIYVDEAAGVEHANDWLVTLQGGGSCFDGQSCMDAYLKPGEQSELGSALQPAMKNMAGIHSTGQDNAFRKYNRVRIHKCGYDRYNGTSVVSNASGTVGDVNNGHRLFWANAEFRHCSDPGSIEPCLPVLSEADNRARVEEQARRLKTDFSERSELAVAGQAVPTVFLWLPDCAAHDGAFDAEQFFDASIGSELLFENTNMHDFLLSFMDAKPGGIVQSRIDGDDDWLSTCP